MRGIPDLMLSRLMDVGNAVAAYEERPKDKRGLDVGANLPLIFNKLIQSNSRLQCLAPKVRLEDL